MRRMSTGKVVLVTGASSGIGRAAAEMLAERGFRVFGTSRRPAARETSSRVQMLPLDVRSEESARACVDTVLQEAGRIDVLVNNAGHSLAGALEETTMEQAKDLFETNFFGAVRMVQAVLPAMRRQRSGQIINMSSLAGLVPAPFMGIYNASKFALEGYSESLRHELQPLNIRVSLVEPGFIKTDLARNAQLGANPIPDYEPWRRRGLESLSRFEERAPGPAIVADRILRMIESDSPPVRSLVGKDASRIAPLRRLLPDGLFFEATRRVFRLDRRG